MRGGQRRLVVRDLPVGPARRHHHLESDRLPHFLRHHRQVVLLPGAPRQHLFAIEQRLFNLCRQWFSAHPVAGWR